MATSAKKTEKKSLLNFITKKNKKPKKEPETFSEHLLSWTKTILGAIVIVMLINGVAIASFVVPTPSMEKTVMTGDFLFVNKFIYGPSTPQVVPFFNIPIPFLKTPPIKKPAKGDVIVFIFPGNQNELESAEFQYYLKRCIAVSGDTLVIKNKEVYVNGVHYPLAKTGLFDDSRPVGTWDPNPLFPYGTTFTKDNYGPIIVPSKGDTLLLTEDNILQWYIFIMREGHEVYKQGNTVFIDGAPANKYIVERDYVFGMGDNRDHSLDSRYFGFIPEENVVGTPIIVYWSWDTDLSLFANFFDKLGSIRWSRFFKFIS